MTQATAQDPNQPAALASNSLISDIALVIESAIERHGIEVGLSGTLDDAEAIIDIIEKHHFRQTLSPEMIADIAVVCCFEPAAKAYLAAYNDGVHAMRDAVIAKLAAKAPTPGEKLRREIFSSLRENGVSEQCFAEIAGITESFNREHEIRKIGDDA